MHMGPSLESVLSVSCVSVFIDLFISLSVSCFHLCQHLGLLFFFPQVSSKYLINACVRVFMKYIVSQYMM